MPGRVTQAEQVWHDQLYGERRDEGLVIPPEVIRRYAALRNPHLFHSESLLRTVGDVKGKRILYLGCGDERSTVLLALKGGEVWAVDLSLPALQRQRTMARINQVAPRIRWVAGAAESLPFPAGSFDLVFGIGILHHLQGDLDTPCGELTRVLRQGGYAVFYEPVILSRLVRAVRDLFPFRDAASPQCRPLSSQSVGRLHGHFRVESSPFQFVARFDRFLIPLGIGLELVAWWRRWTSVALHFADYLVFRVPLLHRLGGGNVLKMTPHHPGVGRESG
jgi:SAM-dependent methyltransferase